MNKRTKEQILFALEDDNEVMQSALDSDLSKENKQMNRELIKKHNKIIGKVNDGKELTRQDLMLISDANEIDVNDEENMRGHHKQAMKLKEYIEKVMSTKNVP